MVGHNNNIIGIKTTNNKLTWILNVHLSDITLYQQNSQLKN